MKKYIFLIFMLALLPNNVFAIHEVIDSRCTASLKKTIKEEAQEVGFRVSKMENSENIVYQAYFYGVTDNIYLQDSEQKIIGESIDNLKPGATYLINIYASNNTYCEGYKAGSKLIKVPYYNPYANSELCYDYEDFSLCDENTNVTLSKEEFEKRRDEYINSIDEEEEKPIPIVEDDFNIIDFILEYKYFFVVGISIILITTLILVIKKRRSERGIL